MSKNLDDYRKALRETKMGDRLPQIELPPQRPGTYRHTYAPKRGRQEAAAPMPEDKASPSRLQQMLEAKQPYVRRAEMPEERTAPESNAEEKITPEELADDPWAAVLFPLPQNPSPELMDGVKTALLHCRQQTAEILGHLNPEADHYWRDEAEHSANMTLIIERLRQVDAARETLDRMTPQAEPALYAHTAPVFCLTLDAIREDPWSAVALPIPEHASTQLLEAARAGVNEFIADAMQKLPQTQDFQKHAYIEESVAEAYERLEMINEKEERLILEPRRQERGRDNEPER